MNTKTRIWIAALRLRTLPLSWAGIVAGTAMAVREGNWRPGVFALSLLTASLYQILSNLANDYGDGVKGTDDHRRQGPLRAVQSGIISPDEMKRAIVLTVILSVMSTLALLVTAFGRIDTMFIAYFLLGLAAVWAAIKYTVGRKAYGYAGLGDLFVLIFFGCVAVCGSYYLYTGKWNPAVIYPALAIGLMSVAVLNLNNMRDRETDLRSGKITLAVKLGHNNAFAYHRALLLISFLLLLYLAIRQPGYKTGFIAPLPALYLWWQSYGLQRKNQGQYYNLMLKRTSLLTLLTAVLLWPV